MFQGCSVNSKESLTRTCYSKTFENFYITPYSENFILTISQSRNGNGPRVSRDCFVRTYH